MDEYITRNNAISAVCLGCNQQFSDEPCEPSDCTIRRSIMALPTADVAPRAEVIEEYRKKVYAKMEKYTVFGREYIQRIMREVEKEMKGGE